MKESFLLLILFLSMSVLVISCKDSKNESEAEVQQTELDIEKTDLALNDEYQCPMDCEHGKTYDKDGACPVCDMALQKVKKEDGESEVNHDKHNHDESPDEQK